MANVITAVVTDDARKFWPQFIIGSYPVRTLFAGGYFKIGEGGWIDTGTGRVPRTPSPSLRNLSTGLQDIDSLVDASRNPVDQRYQPDERFSFEKALVVTDIAFVSPATIQCTCSLTTLEPPGNDDGFGNSPSFYEIGLFTDHPDFPGSEKLMVAYGIFPVQVKTVSRPLENIVLVTFGAPSQE